MVEPRRRRPQPHRPSAIANPDNEVFISAASVWEIAIKSQHGKLEFSGRLGEATTQCGFTALPITANHAEAAAELPWPHPDPFDRRIVAQAQTEHLTLTQADSKIRKFPTISHL